MNLDLEWVRFANGCYVLRRPRAGWPAHLRWYALLWLWLTLRRDLSLCAVGGSRRIVRIYRHSSGYAVYGLNGLDSARTPFLYAADAIRFACIEYGFAPSDLRPTP